MSHTSGWRAVAVRKSMLLPRDDTNAYRLVNGEGDRMSGVGLLPFSFVSVALSCELQVPPASRRSRAPRHATIHTR